MIVDLTQEELWKIQEYVRDVEGESRGLYWDYGHMDKVHKGIMELIGNAPTDSYSLHIEDPEFWWLVVQQIPAGLSVGTDKLFGRRLLQKIMVQLKVPEDGDKDIPNVFSEAFGNDDDDGVLVER